MEAGKLSETEMTLLIVDDEPLMTELFRQSMTRHGFRVLTATGGAEALTIIAVETVHLAITDMTMLTHMQSCSTNKRKSARSSC